MDRHYLVIKQMEKILIERNIAKNFSVINDVLDAWETKSLIGTFDMLVSGRIHGAVAGLSQLVPTVIIDYGHEPKAHKLRGFAIESGAIEYIADPIIENDLINKIEKAYNERLSYKEKLKKHIKEAKYKALLNFTKVKEVLL